MDTFEAVRRDRIDRAKDWLADYPRVIASHDIFTKTEALIEARVRIESLIADLEQLLDVERGAPQRCGECDNDGFVIDPDCPLEWPSLRCKQTCPTCLAAGREISLLRCYHRAVRR